MEKCKKMRNIFITIVVIIFISISIITKVFITGDEFFNYYNTYKIFNGEIIYKDVNILSTPLLFYIGLVLFKLLGSGLIVFKIYNIIINIIIAITIYMIFRNLKIKDTYSIIYTLILELLIINYVAIEGTTYNILGILWCLLGINSYLCRDRKKYYNLKQGIIIFLIAFTKQNIGVYYSVAYILIELVINRKRGFKYIVTTFLITFLCSGLYFIYLVCSDTLDGFINYTILGIKEFTNNLWLASKWNVIIDILFAFFITVLILIKMYQKKEYNNLVILYIFGCFLLLIGYPIADVWHMVVASIILYIATIYAVHDVIIEQIKIKEKYLNVIILIILLYMITANIFQSINYVKNVCTNKNNKYYLINVGDYYKIKIPLVEEYIIQNDKKVIVASAEARNV